MTRVFFPGCKVKARYPEASAWLERMVIERGYADEVTGCCTACDAGLKAGGKASVNLLELISGIAR